MKFLYLFLIFIVVSCGQEQGKLSGTFLSSQEQKVISKECKNVNFHKNFFDQKNLLNIFTCFSWDSEFVELHKFIKSLDEKEFNSFTSSLNEEFYANTKSRNTFLAFLADNIGIWNSSSISKAASVYIRDKKYINLLKLYVNEADELPSVEVLNPLVNLLEAIETKSSKERLKLSKKYQGSNADLKSNTRALLDEMLTWLSDDNFLKYATNFFEDTKLNLSITKNLNEENFDYLFYYPSQHSGIPELAEGLEEVIRDNLYNCSDRQEIYSLNQKIELDKRMNDLREKSHDEFLFSVYDINLKITLFNNICYYPELNQLLTPLLSSLIDFSLIPTGFKILKNIAKTDPKDNYLIFKYAQSDFYKAYEKATLSDSEKIFKGLRQIIKTLGVKEITSIQKLLKALEVNKTQFKSFQSKLKNLNFAQRKTLVNALEGILFESEDNSEPLKLIKNTLLEYPEVLSKISSNISISKPFLLGAIDIFLEKHSELAKDLEGVLSTENLFKILELLTSKKFSNVQIDEIDNETGFIEDDLNNKSKATSCLEEFHKNFKRNYDFWAVLDNYPKSCLELEESDKLIANKIFEWTFAIDSEFEKQTGLRFSVPYGVISSEMMQFYHSLIHMVNLSLDQDEDYVYDTIGIMKRHLFEYELSNVLDSGVILLNTFISNNKNQADSILNYIIKNGEDELDLFLKTTLGLMASPVVKTSDLTLDRTAFIERIGEKRELNKAESLKLILNLKKVLTRRNGVKESLLESIVSLIHPDGKFLIPFDQKKQRNYKFTFLELIEFLHDVSSDSTREKVTYRNSEGVENYDLTLISRLEIVIREISFLNNFYGSFFINKASTAKKYTKNIKALKKNVLLLDKTAGAFRKRGIFPKETKWAFKNIYQTYDSLWQFNSKGLKYGDLIQSLLSTTTKTSSRKSQGFSPFQLPKPKLVEAHNSKFVTLLANNSILTKASNFIRENFSKDEVKDSKLINLLDSNIQKLISEDETIKLMNFIFEHKNFELIANDLIDGWFKIENKSDFMKVASNIATFALENFSKSDMQLITNLIRSVVENYSTIRDEFKIEKIRFSGDLKNMSYMLNTLDDTQKENICANLFTMLKTFSVDDFSSILEKKTISQLSQLIASMQKYSNFKSKESGFLLKFLSQEKLSFVQVHRLIQVVDANDGSFDYIFGIIKTLSTKDDNQTNLNKALIEIFEKSEENIIEFLVDIFNQFNSKSNPK